MPMFPLGMVIFPHQTVGLCVFEPRYRQMLHDLSNDNAEFGSCLIARGSEVGGGDERTMVGTVMSIVASQPLADGQTLLMVEGQRCIEVAEWVPDAPYPRARVTERCCDEVEIERDLLKSAESAVRALRALHSEVNLDESPLPMDDLSGDPATRAWQLCAMTPMAVLDQFAVLSLSDPNERLRLVAEICCERYGDYQRLLAEPSGGDWS